MKVIVFGASGMVGQGVLRECLLAPDVESVLVVGRSALTMQHPKMQQLVRPDLFDYADIEARFDGYDACFFCLGVSASETDEAGFVRINHDLPLAVGQVLVRRHAAMVFVYVSGGGTDSTERGPVMWARVKGKTENALQRLGFRAVYLFRPGFILPLNGEQSKTRMLRQLYSYMGWAFAMLRKLFPEKILDTVRMGQAMLQIARHGNDTAVVESADISRLAATARVATPAAGKRIADTPGK
ncbi:NAD-dependent epimerase/dehydratase family protein [Burkholderia stabilis]|uniref:NAD-dependent epimerase/dehydratase family protein n=1 Tax=Burkholderia stabilis TaxID=95485 RepID=UPI00158E63A4|nr:NAD-dependent epimerase/dehydratase family protein [Burkholderia stabilis]